MKIANRNINDSSMLFLAMILVNAGNYMLNLALGRFLGPEAFAEASIIATFVLMLSFVAIGIQLTTAKFTAKSKNEEERLTTISWINSKVLKISIMVVTVLFLLAPVVKSYLNFDSILPLLIVIAGLPFFFSMAVKRGFMQGLEDFKNLAKTYVFEMILRLTITFCLCYFALTVLNANTTESVAIGFLASFFATQFYKIKESVAKISDTRKSAIIKFVLLIGVYELSQIMINNSDVLMAKHFLTETEAGLYAAIALIGRVVFFGTWTVVTLLFPKVIQRERDGLSHSKLFWNALALVATFGLAIVSVCYLMPKFIISILFGEAYLMGAELLWIYALATSLFACANVFAYYHMSLNNYLPVGITLAAGILQIILINNFHATMFQMVQVQFYLMLGLLIGMTIYHKSLEYIKQYKSNTALAA